MIGCQVWAPAIWSVARPRWVQCAHGGTCGGKSWGCSQAEPESQGSWFCQDCAAYRRRGKQTNKPTNKIQTNKKDCTVPRAQGWEHHPSLPGESRDGVRHSQLSGVTCPLLQELDPISGSWSPSSWHYIWINTRQPAPVFAQPIE